MTRYETTREWTPELGPGVSIESAIAAAVADGTLRVVEDEKPGEPCPIHSWMGRVKGGTGPCPHCDETLPRDAVMDRARLEGAFMDGYQRGRTDPLRATSAEGEATLMRVAWANSPWSKEGA